MDDVLSKWVERAHELEREVEALRRERDVLLAKNRGTWRTRLLSIWQQMTSREDKWADTVDYSGGESRRTVEEAFFQAFDALRARAKRAEAEVEALRQRIADLELAQEVRVESIRSLQRELEGRFTKEQVEALRQALLEQSARTTQANERAEAWERSDGYKTEELVKAAETIRLLREKAALLDSIVSYYRSTWKSAAGYSDWLARYDALAQRDEAGGDDE